MWLWVDVILGNLLHAFTGLRVRFVQVVNVVFDVPCLILYIFNGKCVDKYYLVMEVYCMLFLNLEASLVNKPAAIQPVVYRRNGRVCVFNVFQRSRVLVVRLWCLMSHFIIGLVRNVLLPK
jgi:hypothetical protein